VQDGGVEVVDVDGILGDVVAELVGARRRCAGLDAAAGHPDGEAAGMMIAAVVGRGELALGVVGAAEFAAPDHEGVVEHAALFQVGDERGGQGWSVSLHCA
jgi:hypothetical protein